MLEKNQNYLYFFHGTESLDEQSFFKEGLINYRGTDLNSTATTYVEQTLGNDINEAMRLYAQGHGFKSVVVVKIPFRIFCGIDRNGNGYTPLPIWKYDGEVDYYGRKIATLIPQLIAGMYQQDLETGKETFIENLNYSTDINPNGLQYDDKQIEFCRNYGLLECMEFAEERREHTYNELLESDQQKRPFDDLIDFYKQRGIIQAKDIENLAAKQRFSGIRSTWERFKNWINRKFKSRDLNDEHQNDL